MIIIKNNITKENYNKIIQKINKWSQWKKDFCNKYLLISINSKKI